MPLTHGVSVLIEMIGESLPKQLHTQANCIGPEIGHRVNGLSK
jgi:hypothetical protein